MQTWDQKCASYRYCVLIFILWGACLLRIIVGGSECYAQKGMFLVRCGLNCLCRLFSFRKWYILCGLIGTPLKTNVPENQMLSWLILALKLIIVIHLSFFSMNSYADHLANTDIFIFWLLSYCNAYAGLMNWERWSLFYDKWNLHFSFVLKKLHQDVSPIKLSTML